MSGAKKINVKAYCGSLRKEDLWDYIELQKNLIDLMESELEEMKFILAEKVKVSK